MPIASLPVRRISTTSTVRECELRSRVLHVVTSPEQLSLPSVSLWQLLVSGVMARPRLLSMLHKEDFQFQAADCQICKLEDMSNI